MTIIESRTVLLISGGIDSTVLLYRLIEEGHHVMPLFVNYGQITMNGELAAINTILGPELKSRLVILELPGLRRLGAGSLVGDFPENLGSRQNWFESEYFPNRNMILLSLAAAIAQRDNFNNIAIGLAGTSSYTDTTMGFIKQMTAVFDVVLGNMSIIAPYTGKPRSVVIDDAIRLSVPLDKTFSCNALGDRHCQFCVSCLERDEALSRLSSQSSIRDMP